MKIITMSLAMLTATSLWAGECEKNTAREAVVCLEQKLFEVTEKLNKQTEMISRLEKALDVKVTTKAVNRPSNYIVESPDYNAEFKSCRRVGMSDVDCSFTILNNMDEHRIKFKSEDMKVVLISGKSLAAKRVQIGTSRVGRNIGEFSLPNGVPIMGIATFDGVDEEKAALFRVNFNQSTDYRLYNRSIDFKQISLF